jgi:ferrous iron transport protein A
MASPTGIRYASSEIYSHLRLILDIWVPDMPKSATATPLTLDTLRKGECGVVAGVVDDDPGMVSDVANATIGRRLLELGFVAGEPVEVVATLWPGGDPMAVRVGTSVFALRRREARAVLIEPAANGA